VIEVRQTEEFKSWLEALKDVRAADRIATRVRRMSLGNPGDVKPVGEGVLEARIDHGPGYRLYFVQRGDEIIVLLCGGDKRTQSGDIARAKKLAKEV
jgi:putative addiction module killer protein